MGYFVQEEDSDADADLATSEGIFVYDANATSEVSLGDQVRVAGTVDESYSLTELKTITSLAVCSNGQGSLVKTTSVSLPAASSTYLERYEGMWVTFPQELTVTDNYDLGRYGELTLSVNGKLWQFTHQICARRHQLRCLPERDRAAQHPPGRRQHDAKPGPHLLPRHGPARVTCARGRYRHRRHRGARLGLGALPLTAVRARPGATFAADNRIHHDAGAGLRRQPRGGHSTASPTSSSRFRRRRASLQRGEQPVVPPAGWTVAARTTPPSSPVSG